MTLMRIIPKTMFLITHRFIMLYSLFIKNVKLWKFRIQLMLQNGKTLTIFLFGGIFRMKKEFFKDNFEELTPDDIDITMYFVLSKMIGNREILMNQVIRFCINKPEIRHLFTCNLQNKENIDLTNASYCSIMKFIRVYVILNYKLEYNNISFHLIGTVFVEVIEEMLIKNGLSSFFDIRKRVHEVMKVNNKRK